MKAGSNMDQTRRVAPRVPYDEAIAIARFDGRGRLYARAIDLSETGLHVICAESCPLGTVLARGVGLAISFSNVEPGTAAAIRHLIESHTQQVMPAKLRVAGVDRT